MSTQAELVSIFRRAGTYQPFCCQQCEERGVFVSGPHSHACGHPGCDRPAHWGWYTTPRCAEHRTVEQGGRG